MARLKCPGWLCGSANVQVVGREKKISGCAGCIGFLLIGWIGWLFALLFKKDGKVEYVCMDCGKRFTK